MDPTKSFDHLDPKLKETYARVMGTDLNSSGAPAQNVATQPAPSDPTLSSAPSATFDPTQIASDPGQNQFSSSPLDQQNATGGPNPGTGPTVTSVPGNPALFSPEAAAPIEPVQDTNAPTNASFFSNPSPATSDPSQTPSIGDLSTPAAQPSGAAYTPSDFGASQTAVAEPITQPLPSPSTVNTGAREASPLLRVLYIIGAVIFFLVYTFFWIKVFGLPIPFLNV